MTAALLATVLLSGQELTAGQVVSKMLAYYSDAKSLVGTITMTQRAGDRQATIQTEVQFAQPSKVYILQVLNASYGQSRWLVTSNGKIFSYSAPRSISTEGKLSPEGKRLVEACVQFGTDIGFRGVYQASVASLGDRSTPLDIVFGRKEDLKFRRDQWSTMEHVGKTDVNGVSAYVIGGAYRDYGRAPESGTYQFVIDEQFRLLRYIERETVGAAVNGSRILQEVETVWSVNVTKDATPREELFKVIG